MKGGNPIFAQLLNLPDVWDFSVNADMFKAFLYRSFDLIKMSADGDIIDTYLGWDSFLHLLMSLKELLLGWEKKVITAVDQEGILKRALKDVAMLKTICDNGKVIEFPYVKTLL